MMRVLTLSSLIILCSQFPSPSFAIEVFEGDGLSYPVQELSEAERIKKLTEEYLGNPKNNDRYMVILATPVKSTTRDRQRVVDLTYTYERDILGKGGEVIRKKGDRYNPLDSVTLPNFIIIDGEDEDQIEWAKEKQLELGLGSQILITNGSFLRVKRRHNLRVFRLTDSLQKRLHITHVPCTVIQEENKIVISEHRI